ncbi:rod-binding protein [Treponema primitia]|uniref:rod-binding protein n=1 Tax=Treponema primitia TaxID=88058 RepID=UPI0002555079|nr:rod-binding protein [Treponema primitia]
MDVQALGAQYLNNTRFASPFAGLTGGTQSGLSASSSTGAESGGNGAFAALLESAKMDQILSSVPKLPGNADGEGAESTEPKVNRVGDSAAPETERIPFSNRKPIIDKSGKLYEQCLALETFLTKTLISGMRSTVQKTGLIDDSFAGKMYEDMLYDEYAKTYTENANFGLADLAYLELTGQRGKVIAR